MARYFIELAYKGTKYSGFQIQENANTVQEVLEKAFETLHRKQVPFTGSSRTDAGVHALQNYFHFDFEEEVHPQAVYKLNAILPQDMAVRNIIKVPADAHCRFDATSREYIYRIHQSKNPFLQSTSLFYPYTLNWERMQEAAAVLLEQKNFFAFSKTNTQVKTFECRIIKSEWRAEGEEMVYNIEANRFLRGMVRLLTATLLKVGRGKISNEEFVSLFHSSPKCGFSVPAHGLFLKRVHFSSSFFL